MRVHAGSFRLGPDHGCLLVHTRRRGMGALAGHDLTIEATRWEGSVDVADGQLRRVELTVEARGFAVRQGTGGAMPLTEKDGADIKTTIESKVLSAGRHPRIRFTSTRAEQMGAEGAQVTAIVDGNLEIAGEVRPASVHVELETSRSGELLAHATATIRQSEWGIKPYTAFLGALKVADDVEVDAVVTLQPR